MKFIFSTLLLFTLLVNVLGLTASITGSNSFSMTGSTSFSMTGSTSFSMTGSTSFSMTVSMSLSNTISMTTTGSFSPSNTVSNSFSYTMTGSNTLLRLFAPQNIRNLCPNETSRACFEWDRSVGGVTYTSFDIDYAINSDSFGFFQDDYQSNSYVATNLLQNTPYTFEVQGVINGFASPYSNLFYFNTAPDFRNGVNTIICAITNQLTIECSWNNGKNVYEKMRITAYCPQESTVPTMKQGVRDGQTSVILQGVPKNSTSLGCRTFFLIKYKKFSTQKFNGYAFPRP